MNEGLRITQTTEGYMNPAQRLDAAFATATAKLARWQSALGAEYLDAQLNLADGRQVEVRAAGVATALVRVQHKNGGLDRYMFDLSSHQPLIFEASHMQDPELAIDRHVVEADALGIARAHEFDQLLLDCLDELPLSEQL